MSRSIIPVRKNPKYKRRNPYTFLFNGKPTMPRGKPTNQYIINFRQVRDWQTDSPGSAGPQVQTEDGTWWSVNAIVKGDIINVTDFRYPLPSDYKVK